MHCWPITAGKSKKHMHTQTYPKDFRMHVILNCMCGLSIKYISLFHIKFSCGTLSRKQNNYSDQHTCCFHCFLCLQGSNVSCVILVTCLVFKMSIVKMNGQSGTANNSLSVKIPSFSPSFFLYSCAPRSSTLQPPNTTPKHRPRN